jgi:hypothetical protein
MYLWLSTPEPKGNDDEKNGWLRSIKIDNGPPGILNGHVYRQEVKRVIKGGDAFVVSK